MQICCPHLFSNDKLTEQQTSQSDYDGTLGGSTSLDLSFDVEDLDDMRQGKNQKTLCSYFD